MDFDTTAAVTAVIGLIVGATAVLVLRRPTRGHVEAAPVAIDTDRAPTVDIPAVSEGLSRVLSVLPGAAIVVGPDSAVLRASPPAASLGLVRGNRIMVPQITALVTKVRRDGIIREEEFDLSRPPLGKGGLRMRVRVAPLTSNTSLVLAEDVSEAMRVDAVRRDFVANVSHELKTPVGALSLLSEAVQAASDDPESVRHFAGRMQIESQRLTNMINDLIDLSRLQGADTPKKASLIDSTRVIAESCDATRLAAQAREIEVVVGAAVDAQVYGDEAQLVMALRNLLTNAIAYSPPRTRVAVATRIVPDPAGDVVEISVTDQGIGIPYGEQDRIFERFYRVDPARSRITGGTGLGLAIVKHVCVNHGGECTVWSVEGEGSTFTLRLPTTAASAVPPALEPSAPPRVLRNSEAPPTVAIAAAREERVP